jgi:hypothetical protein
MRIFLAFTLLAIAPGVAQALPTTESWIVRFVAPVQNVTGDQNPNVGTVWDWKSPALGWPIAGTGVSAELIGRPGVVSGNIEGNLDVRYEETLSAPGTAHIGLDFSGIESESRIQTDLHLAARVGAAVKLFGLGPSISLGPDFKWNTLKDFTYNSGQTVSATGRPDSLEVGLGLDLLVAGLKAGLFLESETFFTPGGIGGTVRATHLNTNTILLQDFADVGDVSSYVDLVLSQPGYWYLTLEDLAVVDNEFTYTIEGGLFAKLHLLLFGDVVDVELGLTVPGPDPFPLEFDPVDKLGGGFLIFVVPEPGTGMLLAAGLLGLAAKRRRERVRG